MVVLKTLKLRGDAAWQPPVALDGRHICVEAAVDDSDELPAEALGVIVGLFDADDTLLSITDAATAAAAARVGLYPALQEQS